MSQNQNFKAIIEGVPSLLNGNSIYTFALHLMVDQKNALIADDWDTLEELANQGIGFAYSTYKQLQRHSGNLQSNLSEANEGFAEMLTFHSNDEGTRDEFFSTVKEELLKIKPDISEDFLEGLDDLQNGKLADNPLFNMLKSVESIATDSDMESDTIDITVALAVRSLMALTYTEFHRHNEAVADIDFSTYGDNFYNYIKSTVDCFYEELESSMKMIHGSLVMGLSPVAAADELADKILNALPTFGRVQATIRNYALSLKNAGKGMASEKAGEIAVISGDLTRSAFTAYAAAYYLSLQSSVANQDKKVKDVIGKAQFLSYDTAFPNGKDVEISKVNTLTDGEYVEVAGFVDSIEVGRDNDNKLITQITLHDPSSNSKVVAAGIFVHLRHIGLQEGAFCRLSGVWQSESGINKNNPAIEIEKLSISELASKSWKILFQSSVDKFVERWPGSLNIKIGLSHHVSDAENETESLILGAGELIYKPFIR